MNRELDEQIEHKLFEHDTIVHVDAMRPEGDWYISGEGDKEIAYLNECKCEWREKHYLEWREKYVKENRSNMVKYVEEEELPKRCHGHYNSCFAVVPLYSSCISSAWLIVEKMRERGYDLVLDSLSENGWRANFSIGEGECTKYGLADALTAPEAICLATLEALKSTTTD